MNTVMCVWGVVNEGFADYQIIRKEFTPLTVHYFFFLFIFEPMMVIHDTCMCKCEVIIWFWRCFLLDDHLC